MTAAALAYLRSAGILLPNEDERDLPPRWRPDTLAKQEALDAAVAMFELTGEDPKPYDADWTAELDPPKPKRKRKATQGDLLPDEAPEPKTCGGLCVLAHWGHR